MKTECLFRNHTIYSGFEYDQYAFEPMKNNASSQNSNFNRIQTKCKLGFYPCLLTDKRDYHPVKLPQTAFYDGALTIQV